MPFSLHGGWFMVASCMVCGVSTMLHSYMRPLVHIRPHTIDMLQAVVPKVAREEGPGWLQFKEETVTGTWHGKFVYSNQVGHHTSDIRRLWTAISQTINPPSPPPLVM